MHYVLLIFDLGLFAVKNVKYILLILITCFLSSCNDIRYYLHSSLGHAQILLKRQSLAKLIEDPATPEELKNKLESVVEIRKFAIEDLRLPDADNYLDMVQLESKYVAWNVYLATEFSLALHKWCFPFVGCVGYRGYFNEEMARKFAEPYLSKGFDVHIGSVNAYSTLGWFKDPVFSTLLKWPEERLAGLIFHELAHSQIYIKNDTTFNESFATMVEREGVKRWLEKKGLANKMEAVLKERRNRELFLKAVSTALAKLKALYISPVTDEEKRREKATIFEGMQSHYRQLRGGVAKDDSRGKWLATDMNNAKLASVAIYNDYVPAFENILLKINGNMKLFYQEVAKIAALPEVDRDLQMKRLIKKDR